MDFNFILIFFPKLIIKIEFGMIINLIKNRCFLISKQITETIAYLSIFEGNI